jgi:hypothetical protein
MFVVVAALLLAACEPSGDEEASDVSVTPLDVFSVAAQDLSRRTGVPVEEIELVSVESKSWPDACLGLPEPGEVCAQVITPGNQVILEAGGTQYVYRTDETINARYAGEAQ